MAALRAASFIADGLLSVMVLVSRQQFGDDELRKFSASINAGENIALR